MSPSSLFKSEVSSSSVDLQFTSLGCRQVSSFSTSVTPLDWGCSLASTIFFRTRTLAQSGHDVGVFEPSGNRPCLNHFHFGKTILSFLNSRRDLAQGFSEFFMAFNKFLVLFRRGWR